MARRVAGWGRPEVGGLAVHQLTPELAPALADAEVVVFVDACVEDGEREVCLRRLEAGPAAVMGHTSDPRWLLALAGGLRPAAGGVAGDDPGGRLRAGRAALATARPASPSPCGRSTGWSARNRELAAVACGE